MSHCLNRYPYYVGLERDHFHIWCYRQQKLQSLVYACNNQGSSDGSDCLLIPCLIVNCSSCRWLVFSEFLAIEVFYWSRAAFSFCVCIKHVHTRTCLGLMVGSFVSRDLAATCYCMLLFDNAVRTVSEYYYSGCAAPFLLNFLVGG